MESASVFYLAMYMKFSKPFTWKKCCNIKMAWCKHIKSLSFDTIVHFKKVHGCDALQPQGGETVLSKTWALQLTYSRL